MKTVLIILNAPLNPHTGGVQTSSYKLGKYFTKQGLKVYYFSFSTSNHINPENGVLHYPKQEGRTKNPANLKKLTELVKNIQPTFVINQIPYQSEVGNALYKLKQQEHFWLFVCIRTSLYNFKNNVRNRLMYMVPGWLFRLMDNPLGVGMVKLRHWFKHRWQLKTMLKENDVVMLLTPANKEELAHFVGTYPESKVKNIPNSIPKVYDDKPLEKDKVILHVGRLDIIQKRADLLLDFWEKTYQKLPEWRFVIVGDGPYFNELKNQIEQKQLPRIQLEGRQKPDPYFESASIFMMPSAFEGFPNVILEAQSYGVIPVAFDSYPALSWIINNEEDGFLLPPFDTKAMADQTAALVSNNDHLVKMKKASLNNAKRFTIDNVGQQWLALFKSLTYNSKKKDETFQ